MLLSCSESSLNQLDLSLHGMANILYVVEELLYLSHTKSTLMRTLLNKKLNEQYRFKGRAPIWKGQGCSSSH